MSLLMSLFSSISTPFADTNLFLFTVNLIFSVSPAFDEILWDLSINELFSKNLLNNPLAYYEILSMHYSISTEIAPTMEKTSFQYMKFTENSTNLDLYQSINKHGYYK